MSDWLQVDQATFWFILGFVLIAIELLAFGMASGVLLFGGLGAIVTGILLWIGVIPNEFIVAVASFAVSSALATAALWYPFKRMQSGAELGHDRSSDLIGHSFVLAEDVSPQSNTQQKYSGIQWRVQPSEALKNPVMRAGTRVTVTAVSVGVFFVEPSQEVM